MHDRGAGAAVVSHNAISGNSYTPFCVGLMLRMHLGLVESLLLSNL